MTASRLCIAVLLGAGLTACSDAYPATRIPTSAGTITIQLLDAGAEPRRKLEYDLEEGSSDAMEMELKMGMRVSIGSRKLPKIDAPPIRMRFEFDPWVRTPGGHLRGEFTLAEAEMLNSG
ncbi:MAG: hypothetical protein ACE5JG_08970, partial [Planctomycetota bacterium]